MKNFKSFYEEMTFKVEVDGLPALFMSGNSPGQVKNHLRKLIKQPSMIKSVERQTKHNVKKMYRDKAQGKEVAESKDMPPREYDYEGEMTKQQLRTIEMASKELQAMISDDQNLPEWWQNKITLATDYMQTARDYLKSDVKEGTINELSPDTVKSYKKAASKSNYSAAQKYARVAGSPTSRKYKNKEMGKQDDIMRKRKAGLAMADKKVDEKLTIGKIRRAAYKTGKVLGDVNAVKKGKVAKRVKNRIVGKLLGKAVGKLGLFK